MDGFCFPSANIAKADMYAVIVLRRVVSPVRVCRLSIQSLATANVSASDRVRQSTMAYVEHILQARDIEVTAHVCFGDCSGACQCGGKVER